MSSNYKATLNLPKTDFPMKADLVQREPELLRKWDEQSLYQQIQNARKNSPRFVLHDGPPFANGDVHMGTALNKILKDIIVKSRSMMGYCAPFVPGWDCHGLPIEFKVVRESRGLSPIDVRRKSEEYARKFIDIQRRQFKRLGVFGDWENPYLTLSPDYEAVIIRAFAEFVEKGLVYQSKKPVYWSTGAQTALAEAEVEYQERFDPAIFVKFAITSGPLANKASVVVWTTTPWTLPANVAIAVHPDHRYVCRVFRNEKTKETLLLADELVSNFESSTGFTSDNSNALASFTGRELEGTETQHPFLDRKSKIILGDFVTLESGTGGVHIAPGHGADDYIAGVKYGLPILSPVDEHGRFTEEVGVPVWAGKYVFEANTDVVALLRERKALLGEEIYKHTYPHCWRSKTPVVFRAVEQFFIHIEPLRADALKAIDQVQWLPRWGRNRIYSTVETRPDWCISRQRSWGVPLPVFYGADGTPILNADWARRVADLVEKHGTNIWFELDDASIVGKLGLPPDLTRRNDTLDVWIDSGVSHEAVLRRHPELHAPADIYLEATDQHRGWFNSSLMTSVALHGTAPYRTCITHGFVVDEDRKKISKSGSYEKPMDAEHFVSKHGADIVRLWVSSVNFTDDVPFSEEMFTRLADTYRRMRNTLRILLANLYDFESGRPEARNENFTMIDRWIVSRLQEVITTCRAAYESYEFHKVYHALNQFCAVDLSSIYVDVTKDRMYCDAANSQRRRATQTTMSRLFDDLARLLAPILVFTAEEAWGYTKREGSVHLETLPEPDQALRDVHMEQHVDALLQLRGVIGQAVEQARQSKLIGNTLEADVTLQIADANLLNSLRNDEEQLEEFFILSSLKLVAGEPTRAIVVRTQHAKCQRCWRHRPTVGQSDKHPDLCDRCAHVVTHAPEGNASSFPGVATERNPPG
jgi:isoleucyl-tRNA synthetase